MMTPADGIPEHVLRFIDEYIDTVPQLETLLMLAQERSEAWTVGEIAARNYISEARAHEILEILRRRSLLSFDEQARRFRFAPVTEELRTLIAEVALSYQKNLSRIATLIHSKPSASIMEFARAFDLKKDR